MMGRGNRNEKKIPSSRSPKCRSSRPENSGPPSAIADISPRERIYADLRYRATQSNYRRCKCRPPSPKLFFFEFCISNFALHCLFDFYSHRTMIRSHHILEDEGALEAWTEGG